MTISAIIPTFQEEGKVGDCFRKLRERAWDTQSMELIVSDGGSTDRTLEEARAQAPDQVLRAPSKGRAVQMNHAAANATGDILYFLHADAWPPEGFDAWIRYTRRNGYPAGTFRFRFKPMKPFILWLNSFMTRFSWPFTQGGDRSLYIDRERFQRIGGFDEEQSIMEDFEILQRIREEMSFTVIPRSMEVSPRKYQVNGYFRVQYANFIAMRMFRKGEAPDRIRAAYIQLLHPSTPGYERGGVGSSS